MTDETNTPDLAPLAAAVLAEMNGAPVSASVAAHAISQAASASQDADTLALPTVTIAATGHVRALTPTEYRSGIDLVKRREASDLKGFGNIKGRKVTAQEIGTVKEPGEAAWADRVVKEWEARRAERPVPLADRVDWDAPIEEIEASVEAVAEEVFAQINQAAQIKRGHLTLLSGGAR